MRRSQVALTIALIAMATTGCAAAPIPTPTSDAPVPVPTVTVTSTAAPVERTPESPLTTLDVYALCKSQTTSYLMVDSVEPADLIYPSLSDTRIEQIDGTWYALIAVSGTSADPMHVSCAVSGTIGNPTWLLFGAGIGVPDDHQWEGLVNGGE